VRQHAHLPGALGRACQYRLLFIDGRSFEGACVRLRRLAVTCNHPALRYGIPANFHSSLFSPERDVRA
jgi:hypothetical protein